MRFNADRHVLPYIILGKCFLHIMSSLISSNKFLDFLYIVLSCSPIVTSSCLLSYVSLSYSYP